MWNDEWAAEAAAGGIRIVPLRRALHGRELVAEAKCKFNAGPGLKDVIQKFAGEKYDIKGLFVIGWATILWRIFKRKIRKPLNNTAGQFCSEFGAHFLQSSCKLLDYDPLKETKEWDPELIDPEKLLSYTEQNVTAFDTRFI